MLARTASRAEAPGVTVAHGTEAANDGILGVRQGLRNENNALCQSYAQ